jgi:HAMP domain-containing protein
MSTKRNGPQRVSAAELARAKQSLVEAATKAAGRAEPWEQRRALKDAARFAAERDRIAPDFIPRPRQGETVTAFPPNTFAPPVTGARAADVVVTRREVRLDDGWSFDVNEWRGPAIAETSGVTVPVNPPLVFNRNAFVLSGQSITAGEISAIAINGEGRADQADFLAGPTAAAGSMSASIQLTAQAVAEMQQSVERAMRAATEQMRANNNLALLGAAFGFVPPADPRPLTAASVAAIVEQTLTAEIARTGLGASVTVPNSAFPPGLSGSAVASILQARGITGLIDARDNCWVFRRISPPPAPPLAPGEAESNMATAILSALRDAAAGRSGGLAQVTVSEDALARVDTREVFQILRIAGAIEEYDAAFGNWAISLFIPPVPDPGPNAAANRGLFASGAAGMATLSRPERQAVVTPLPPAQDPFPATPHKRRIRLAPGPAA